MAGEEIQGGWDFFVSYAQADRAWAEWIAWILEEDGHRVLVQAWDFVLGSNWVHGMQAGTRDATRTIAVLSPAYLESVYGGAEWQAAWASDPDGADRKLLIVRVIGCERAGLLAGVVGVDLFGLTEAAAKERLRGMVSAAIAGRAKPARAPVFPGARVTPRAAQFPGALPQVWKVPARNPNFTGRGQDLDGLADALAAGSAVTVHSVRGMGGVGKTQLAVEYAHAHAAHYALVWWIAAEQPASMSDQFAALARRLDLDPAADPEALQAQVHDRLWSVPGWLLIFDNADAVEDLRPWLPTGPLPPGIPGHVIVTTRRGGFPAVGRVMDLDVVGLPDAVRLLRAWVPGLGYEVGEQIAEELGRLPLALEQAAAYLDRSQMPGKEYLELLRNRAAELYVRGGVTFRTDPIAKLWDISLDRITGESLAAAQLLGVSAYLAPEPIPLDLFTAHRDLLPEPLSSAAADRLAFGDAVAVLVDYSLAKRTSAGLQVHPLVQATIRGRRPAGDPSAVALRLLRAAAPAKIMGAPDGSPRRAALLPHLLAAGSFGYSRFDTSVAHIARVYNYWLGGKDNFAADRAAGEQAIQAYPGITSSVRANRAFMARAVRYLAAEAGIRQFLDIGTGIPAANNTHEVAQCIAPECRVVYVDNDPIVLAHARTLLKSSSEGTTDYVDADLRDIGAILAYAARTLDLSRPVAIMLIAILHLIGDDDDPYAIVAKLLDAMPPGSYLAVSHVASDIEPEKMAETSKRLNQLMPEQQTYRSHAEVARFFHGLDMVEPGVVPGPQWRPGSDIEAECPSVMWSGVGRKS